MVINNRPILTENILKMKITAKHFYRSFLFGLLVLMAFPAISQNKTYNEEVTVVAPYEPAIADASKINLTPEISLPKPETPTLNYSIRSFLVPTFFQVEPIKPANIAGETLPELTKGYVKGGLGNYFTPYLEAFYNSLRTNEYAWGAHLMHLSDNGKINDYSKSTNSLNQLDVYGKKFFTNKTMVSGEMGFSRRMVHFYGFHPDDFLGQPSKGDLRQRFALFNASAGFQSDNPEPSALNYSSNISFYYFADRFKTGETNLKISGAGVKDFRLFDFTKMQSIGLEAQWDYYHNSDSLSKYYNAILTIKPYISTIFNDFTFKAGLNPVIETGDVSKFHLYPVAKVQLKVLDEVLLVEAGIDGGLQRNSYKEITTDNPFVNSDVTLKNTSNTFKIFAGVKSRLANDIDLQASISSASLKNQPFFITDTVNVYKNRFLAVYDDVNLFNIHAEGAYHMGDKITMTLNADFFHYSMDKLSKPWNCPDFKFSYSAKYKFLEKFVATADIYAWTKTYVRDYRWVLYNDFLPEEPQIEDIKTINGAVDANLGLEYRYSKKISGFVNLNNILNTKYFQYYNYPSQRFNFLLGATYSF